MTGKYIRGSVRIYHKVLIWFAANPDEYLTVQDISDKFGGSIDTINSGLRHACQADLLTKTQHPDESSASGQRTHYEAGSVIRMVLGLSPINEES